MKTRRTTKKNAARARASKTSPSKDLLGAAIAGLFTLAGCAEAGPHVISEQEDTTMTVAKFTELCSSRSGLVQTHAACAGVNSCRGVSYNKYDFVLTEHTCRALNTCGGMSCVELPEDSGLTGEDVYEESCAGCHAREDDLGSSYVALLFPAGADLEQETQDFLEQPVSEIVPLVAFGVSGQNANGTSNSNMAGYHDLYSIAEIERVIEHMRSSTIKAEHYGTLGVDEEVDPSGE